MSAFDPKQTSSFWLGQSKGIERVAITALPSSPPSFQPRSRLRDAVQNVTRVTYAPAGFGKLATNRDIAGQGPLRPCVMNSIKNTCQGPH